MAAGSVAVAAAQPVVWDILGYHFEAGPFIVAVCATLMTRLAISLERKTRPRWILDIVVTALCVMISALWVQANRLALLPAGLSGIAFGAIGLGIIGIAKSHAAVAFRAALQTFLRGMATMPVPAADPGRGPKPDQDADLIEKLDQHE